MVGRAQVPEPRAPRFWLPPIVISTVVLAVLAAVYLGAVLNPTANLKHFPIAVVNQDDGPVGAQLTEALTSGLDGEKFDVRVLSDDEARRQLDTAQIYGEVRLPAGLSQQLTSLGRQALQPGQVTQPIVTISTNPRAGTAGAGIASQTLTRALAEANAVIGRQLAGDVARQTGDTPLSGGVELLLDAPINVTTVIDDPLPDGTGSGQSAFYYALLLLLAGFTGSTVVSALVDSQLGYAASEFGPMYRQADPASMSRFTTLLVKWALMLVLAVLTSTLYLGISTALGMPIPHGWALWFYGMFAIAAVGVTSISIIAVLGSLGTLVSLLIFVILGLPSAGATIPLQASPGVFRWLATFEPMHQVFLGARALLYFDGRADAGLTHALIMTTLGSLIGVLGGAAITKLYDRKGFHRMRTIDGADPLP